jgi:hypothetical protein
MSGSAWTTGHWLISFRSEIIGAGIGWIAVAHSALIVALGVLTIAVGLISLLTELRNRMY